MSAATAIHERDEPERARARRTTPLTTSDATTFWRMTPSARRASPIAAGRRVEVVAHQRDVGASRARRRCRPRPSRCRRGGGQRGRVVDAVADHRHRARRARSARDAASFSSGSSPARPLLDAGRARRPRGRRPRCRRSASRRARRRAPRSARDAPAAASGARLVGEAEQPRAAGRPRRARSRSAPPPRAPSSAARPAAPSALVREPRAAGPQRAAVDRSPATPRPGSATKRVGLAAASSPRSRAARTQRRPPAGARSARSTAATSAQRLALVEPPSGDDRRELGTAAR